MSFWGEIKRRKVFQVAATYGVVAWLLVQIVSAVREPLALPDWFDTAAIVLLAIGFPITLMMSWAYDLTADGLIRDRGGPDVGARSDKKLEFILIGVLVLAVGWIIYRVEFDDSGEISNSDRDVLPNSIAVLLCDSFSTDPNNDFFAASLHEELLNQLVKLRGLSVIARTSVLQYADAARPITEIAAELRVESVMECSVAYGDGRILISAQLIDGSTGVHVWSERYNRTFDNVFDIQADIATQVANALAVAFSTEEYEAIERPPTDSPEAYALYLRVLAAVGGSFPESAGDFGREALLDRAIELDPSFALAYAMKAELLDSTDEAAALEAAETALEIDPTLGIAHAALADIHRIYWRADEARQAFETAIELSPNDSSVLRRYAMFQAVTGRGEAATELARRALQLDPQNPSSHATLAWAHHLSGDWDAAAAAARRAIELAPASYSEHMLLARVELSRKSLDSARDQLRLATQLLPSGTRLGLTASRMELAYTCQLAGLTDEARRLLAEQEAEGLSFAASGVAAIFYHLARDDYDAALRALNAAAEEKPSALLSPLGILHLAANVWSDPVLEEPRFRDARRRLRFFD